MANYITISRILLSIGVFAALYQEAWLMSLGFYGAGVVTDLIDGRLARRLHIASTFGRAMDSTADKILVTMALSGFVFLAALDILFLVAFLFRELLIFGLRAITPTSDGRVAEINDRLGRLRFLVLHVGILLIYGSVVWPTSHLPLSLVGQVLVAASIITAYLAATYYIWRDRRLISLAMRPTPGA